MNSCPHPTQLKIGVVTEVLGALRQHWNFNDSSQDNCIAIEENIENTRKCALRCLSNTHPETLCDNMCTNKTTLFLMPLVLPDFFLFRPTFVLTTHMIPSKTSLHIDVTLQNSRLGSGKAESSTRPLRQRSSRVTSKETNDDADRKSVV